MSIASSTPADSSAEYHERRSRLLDALPAIAWSASVRTFRFTYVTAAAETLLGYPVERWIEEPNFWIEHLHPEDRHVPMLCHTDTLAGRDHELVYRMIAADGRTVWLRDYVKVHKIDGMPVELFGVMVDITREREAEAASNENRENFRRMVELSPDCIGVYVDGAYVYVNQAFVQLMGATSEAEIVGRSALSFVDESCQDIVRERLERLNSGQTVPYIRQKYRCIDGSPLDVEVGAMPLRYGNRDAVQVIARDVTARVRAEEELRNAERMSSLGQVAASLAHEFNNVLMGIQPFVEVISRNSSSARVVADAVDHITRAIGRGKRASQEILRFANPKEPQLFAIDAATWLPTLLGQLVAALPTSIALSSSIDEGVGFVNGDREHLEQVITNLVFNARDAIVGSGKIHIGVSVAGTAALGGAVELVRISVTDDGPGIPPLKLDRIFDPLFTTKRNGTGLGLAIARRLMEGQRGTLTAENRPEGGAAFHLLVPAAAPSSRVVPRAAGATLRVKRVLLVEDDLSVGTGLQALLNSEGFEITWVRAGADAPEAARRMRPDVAIIDINLPDGNGVDLMSTLRAEDAGLPVVLSTGHVELNVACERKRTLSLMKPYEIGELLAAIGNVTNEAA
ncbi:MAG TPA: PAS domain S-box protein [Thermoanaerobaculia bacterium]|nr:PAS domain S-box protein [Thermoanaerobaculia bacterium]